MKKTGWIYTVSLASAIGVAGCGKQSGKGHTPGSSGSMPPPAVRIVETRLENASPVITYIAHVEPIQQVQLMAQVVGTIKDVHFREGTRVKQGDLLFTIDPAPYEAILAGREAEREQAQAMLNRAEKYIRMLNAADNRSVSKSDMDSAEANVAEGKALVHKSEALVRQAEINLGYTRIISPIDGRIGRALITRGNLVSPSSGPLATVIQIDPIRVVFAMPDAEYLTAFERYSGELDFDPDIKVRLGNGVVLPEEGEIEFDDNQMNPATGTIDIRLRFPNPNRLLVPNNFVTVMIEEGKFSEKIVIPVDALMHGRDGAYVWCVLEDQSVTQKPVVTGAVIGPRQIIESGLEPGERVVTSGVQNLRPGIAVSPIESEPSK